MVRVISVHHFANQHIQVLEQPTACTIAPPNRLLSALLSNCVEVRDLSNESEVLFSFPTVDEVIQIVHCLNGDYVATVETKFNRQNKEINFVRIYINWDSVATMQQSKMTNSGVSLGSSECGMVQPMRARIAGRVTPTTNQSELGCLEMIEIPVKRNPKFIDCCQISGNLLILSNAVINLYSFQIKTHDISKMRFVDFEELPLLIELSFSPFHIAFCENYIACMNKDTLHLFKVIESEGKSNGELNNSNEPDFSFIHANNGPIDYKKLLTEEKLNSSRENITVNLPTIVKENSLIHKSSPFTYSDKDVTATIRLSSPLENKFQNYVIENLIQLKLIPILIESAQRQVTEEFKSMILKPFYIDQSLNGTTTQSDNQILRSDFNKCLNSIVCIIATQQEGYLYHFDDNEPCIDRDNCLAIYPFTAPVFKLVMEDHFLHALTETGLESYTLRYGHQMCRNFDIVDNINVACPPITDSICLVGLRPFLCVEQILLSENYMVLLANSETSPAHSASSNSSSNVSFLTLYNLELPSPKMVFNDISIVANVHRFTSVQTYCQLMSEAHMVLRMVLLLKKWIMSDDNVRLIALRDTNNDDVIETYRISCALLGDHYVMCNNEDDYSLAIPYYKMARILPVEVLKRVKKIQEQSGNQSTKGLMHYLKKILLEVRIGSDADKIFGSNSKENLSESILDLLESHCYRDLPNLILKSKIIREYSTDKLISILTEKVSENFSKLAEKYLALTILYIQKCNTNKAQEYLEKISRDSICDLVLENYDLLFETTYSLQNRNKGVTTFSELTVLLISVCPELLSSIFVSLMINRKVINLNKVIKVFLEYLPSSIGNGSNSASLVLQKTLEMYFEQYFSKPENIDLSKIIYERGACEAMKLLVRSYLSQLQILQLREESNNKDGNSFNYSRKEDKKLFEDENDTDKDRHQEKLGYNQINQTYFEEQVKKPQGSYLFSNLRYEYLDKMPPFQIEISSKLYETCIDSYAAKAQCSANEEADLILKKLQALLCSQVVPKQVITEVNGYLAVNETLRGNESLQSITMGTNDAILMLIEACPQCLLQFGKDRFCRTDEWKLLVATVQRRILKLSQNENLKRVCFFHKKILKDCPTQRRRLKLTAVPCLNLPKTSDEAATVKSVLQRDKENIPEEPEEPVKDILNEFRVDEIYPSSCSSGPSQGILQFNDENLPKTIDMPSVSKQEKLVISREGSSDRNMEVCTVSSNRIDCLAIENCTSTEKDAIEALLKLGHILQPSRLDKGVQVKSGDLVTSITDRIISRSQLVTMTGIPSFELLNTIVDLCTEMFHRSKKYKLSMKECILFSVIKLKTGISYAVLSVLFSITKASCKTVFYHTLSMLAKVLKPVICWPSLDDVRENTPTCFKDFLNVRVVVDCTEIPIEKVKCLCCRLKTYSQYKKHQTVKFMTGVSPSGLITFVSNAYGGRTSDTEIFKQSGLIERGEMFRDHIMVDKGFLIQDFAGEYGIKVIQPPFLKKKPQFSKEEALLNAKIARARVHIERSNQRIKMFAILGKSLPYNLLPQVDNIITVICAIVNLSAPIFGDDKFL